MEIKINVFLQIDTDNADLDPITVERSAREAVENALEFASNAGFSHSLANELSIDVVGVEVA
jgi:hypothetical protein